MKRYGVGTRLNPPFVHNGKAWGMAFKFSAEPSGHAEGVVICSGVIQSVVDLGGGRVRIVVRRDYQMSDYDKSIPGEGTINIVTQHFMGGNACNSPEWMRAISHANDMAMRGTLAGIRALTGDGFRITRAGKKHMSEILLANAYAHVNEEVNYNGDATILPPTYIQADINDVGCTRAIDADGAEKYYEAGTLYFDDAAPEPMNCGLWIDTGSELELAERLVFDSPETSAPDENYLPPDFGAGVTGAKYWWDPLAMTARLASSCAGVGSSALLVWFNKNVPRAEDLPRESFTVVEATAGVTGFADAGDKIAMSGFSVGKEFDVHFLVFQEGFAGWRRGTEDDAAAVWLSCSSGGYVSMMVREDDGDTVDDVAVDEGPFTYPFQVRLVRDGAGLYTGYARNIGDGWTTIGTVTPSGVPAISTGLLGFGVETNRASGYSIDNTAATVTRELYRIGAGIEAAQHLQRYKTVAFDVSRTHAPGSGADIDEIRNMTSDVAMTESATPQRDHYDFDGSGNLVLYSESNDDGIKITYEELDDAPPGPGMPPRTFSQPNFATFAEPITEDRLATTDVAENIANNSDVIEIALEQTSWMPEAGEAFEIVRGAGVWPTSATITPQLDHKNDDEHDFEALDAEHYHVYSKYMGLVLLAEEARAAIEAESVCMLVDTPRYVVRQAVPSINELKGAVEALDGLWIDLGKPSGGLGGISATARIECGPTSQSVKIYPGGSQTWWPDNFAWGTTKEHIDEWWEPISDDPPTYLNGAMPYRYGYNVHDLRLRSGPFGIPNSQVLTTPPPAVDAVYEEGEDVIEGEYQMDINPYEAYPGISGGAFGVDVMGAEDSQFFFTFSPMGFNFSERTRAFLQTVEVIEARIPVKIHNLKYQTLSITNSIRAADNTPGSDVLASSGQTVVNGHIIAWTINGEDQEFDEPPEGYEWETGGPIAFAIIGIRHNSQFVTSREGTIYEKPAYQIISGAPLLSGGLAQPLNSDEWGYADVTDGVRMMLSLADSPVGYDGFMVVPSFGNPSFDANPESLGAYLDTLKPQTSVTFNDNFPDWFERSTAITGRRAEYDNIEFGSLQVRIRLGDGPAEWMALPMVMPVMRATVV